MIRLINHFLRGKVCWRKIFCSNNSTWKGKLENFKKNVNSSFFLNGKAGKRRSYSRDSNLIAWLKSGTRICHLPAVDRGQVCQKYFKKTVIKPWWNKKKWSSWETDHYNFDLWLRVFFHWYVGKILGGGIIWFGGAITWFGQIAEVILVEGRRTNRASSEPLWASVAQTVYRWN